MHVLNILTVAGRLFPTPFSILAGSRTVPNQSISSITRVYSSSSCVTDIHNSIGNDQVWTDWIGEYEYSNFKLVFEVYTYVPETMQLGSCPLHIPLAIHILIRSPVIMKPMSQA